MKHETVSRRQFITSTVLASTGLLVGVPLADLIDDAHAASSAALRTAYIRIPHSGPIIFIMPKVEMGQGIHTGLAMLLAEELELRLDQITVESAPPLPAVYGVDNDQSTGGSTSTRDCWHRLRIAGATMRQWLIEGAAHHWQVHPRDCTASEGVVSHFGSNRSLRYGELVSFVHNRPLPHQVSLKTEDRFKLIGRSQHRIDSPIKVDGSAIFGIDVRVPGLVFAAIEIAPTIGGTVQTMNQRAAMAVSGVRQIINEGDLIAVVAQNTYATRKGVEALSVQWSKGPFARVDQASIYSDMRKAMQSPAGAVAVRGKAVKGTRSHSAEYVQPFLAHATMEPMNATVRVDGEHVEIWTGTQAPDRLVDHIAQLGFVKSKITLHNQLIGGGFGRRLDVDAVEAAVRIAKHVGTPVQVLYSREQDMRHDRYRPCYIDQLSADLDEHGTPVFWSHKIAGGSASVPWDGKPLPKGVDPDVVEGSANLPYAFANVDVRYFRVEPKAIPVSWWRGVGPTRSVLVVESFIDELAHVAKVDPIEYRLRWLKPTRARHVLDQAKAMAKWNQPREPNHGLGVAVHAEFGSFIAQIVEVHVAGNEINVLNVYTAMDCGCAVNPDQVKAQIEGGSIFGLTAALYGEITIREGQVEQSNFHDYPLLRLDQSPSFETSIIASNESPGGVGETATACIQAALLNAVFSASGQRVRSLPIKLS